MAAKKVKGKTTSAKKTPPPAPLPEVPLAERLAQVRAGLESTLAKLWGASPVIAFPSIDGVTLRGVCASRVQPHWHLVSSGLAELGFELSLKVPRSKEDAGPPAWAQVVMGLAVQRARTKGLGTYHLLPMAKGVGEGPHNDFEALAAVPDPDFGLVGGVDMRVPVLCLVGLFVDEVRLVREWSIKSLIDVYLQVDPLASTSPDRASLLMSPRTRLQLEAKVDREGSTMESFEASVSEVSGTAAAPVWSLDNTTADGINALLKGRTGHGRHFVVQGSSEVSVRASDTPRFEYANKLLTLHLNLAAARALRAQLRGDPGDRTVESLPGLTLKLVGDKA
jgi:hypothetical protein